MSWMDDVLDAKRRGWSPPEGQQQEEVTMSEKYTPDETELIGCYAGAMKEQAGENYEQAKADAERGIAKIKADALRSAAEAFEAAEVNLDVIPAKDRELWRGRNEQRAASVASLRARASRIEEEA